MITCKCKARRVSRCANAPMAASAPEQTVFSSPRKLPGQTALSSAARCASLAMVLVTRWRVQWFDATATVGWVLENWLERIAVPLNVPPVLAAIPNFTLTEGFFTFTNTATASTNAEVLVTDFKPLPAARAAARYCSPTHLSLVRRAAFWIPHPTPQLSPAHSRPATTAGVPASDLEFDQRRQRVGALDHLGTRQPAKSVIG